MKKQRTTLHDVAKQAGVSYQTVSRVINEHPSVSPDTRARIQKAIVELGYQPNMVAKSLAANRSNTLAVLTFGMRHFGPTQMVVNVERTARGLGYDLIFSNVTEPTYEEVQTAINSLNGRQVDGILAISPVAGITYEAIVGLGRGVPIVQIDPEIGRRVPSVVVDQEYGSRLATEHLIGLGHQRLVEISGPLNWFGALSRHEAWQTSLQKAGLTPVLSVEGDWSAQSGYDGAKRLLAQGADFTALVAGNDQMALGAIYAMHEQGRRVPEDVSVVGFDDIPEAAFFRPALTTIRQDFNQLGELGVRYLLDLIRSPETPIQQYRLYPKLVVRQSTISV